MSGPLTLNSFGLHPFTMGLPRRCVRLRQAQPERVFVVRACPLSWQLSNDGTNNNDNGYSQNKNNIPMEVRL